jgi:hypothetical protein
LTTRAESRRHTHSPSPGSGVPGAEGGEVEGVVVAAQFGAGDGQAGQAFGQRVGADEDGGAVVGFEGQQAGVGRYVAWRLRRPGSGADLPAFRHAR